VRWKRVTAMIELMLVIAAIVAFDLVAVRYGVDSRER
jgi:hypothetical protein